MNNLLVKTLGIHDLNDIVRLTKHLNSNYTTEGLHKLHTHMFQLDTYTCFGLYLNDILIGITSGWITVRLYSGKQLEIDNVIISPDHQSKGYGSYFLNKIEAWAKTQACNTVELNTYVENSRSHKFYYNHGYKILGFHFQKTLE